MHGRLDGRQDNGDDEGDGEGPDDELLGEVIMAVEMKEHGGIGCAYFSARNQRLYLLEEVALGSLEILESLLIQIQPTTVIISVRCPERLSDFLEKGAVSMGNQTQGIAHASIQCPCT